MFFTFLLNFTIRFVGGNGFHIVGAHTDSPCLKLKPVSKVIDSFFINGCLINFRVVLM